MLQIAMREQDQILRRLAEARHWKKPCIELRGLYISSLPPQLLVEPFQFKIVAIDISFNRLPDLSGIGRLKNLKTLCARNNILQELAAEINGLHSLTTLDVAHNQIKEIPDYLSKLHELRAVNLSGNRIRHLPESLTHSCKLEQLHVSKNPIQNVPRDILVQGEHNSF